MKYSRIYAALLEEVWAISPAKLEAIMHVVEARATGKDLAALDEKKMASMREAEGSIAVVTIGGTISPYIGSMAESSGGVSAERISGWIAEIVADSAYKAAVIRFRTPGGAVAGVPELAAQIRAAREVKPVFGIVDHLAASAGYWLASQCSELSITPSGMACNIGVLAMREWDDEEEVRRVIVQAGPRKAQASGYEKPDDETIDRMQSRVDAIYAGFVSDIAAGRGVSAEQVENDFGRGELLSAQECLDAGAVDRIETMGELLARITEPPKTQTPYARMKARAAL